MATQTKTNFDALKKGYPTPILTRMHLSGSHGSWRGSCPFCGGSNETEFALTLTPKGVYLWQCFACREAGSVIDFVMQAENCDVARAAAICETEMQNASSAVAPKPRPVIDIGERMSAETLARFEGNLMCSEIARQFLKQRGISMTVAKLLRFGVTEKYFGHASHGACDQCGPHSALVIPRFWNGELIGVKYRNLDSPDKKHKWTQEFGCPADFIYNADAAPINQKSGCVCVLEGELDVALCLSLGHNAVGIFGANGAPEPDRASPRVLEGVALLKERYAHVVLLGDQGPTEKEVGEAAMRRMNSLIGRGACFMSLPQDISADKEPNLRCHPPYKDLGEAYYALEVIGGETKDWLDGSLNLAARCLPVPRTATKDKWVRPMHEDAFYGLAGDFVRLVESETESDRHALLANFLTMAGVLFGRNAYALADGKTHYTNEYMLLVGDSGFGARKGTATDRTRPVFEKVDPNFKGHVLTGLSTGEGLVKGTEPKDHETANPDQPRSYLAMLTEYATLLSVMKRDGNTMSSVLRNAWDTTELRVLTRKEPLRVDNVNISLIGHITPSELLSHLDATERANGFANRHLVVAVRRSKLLPEGGAEVNVSDIVLRLHRAVEESKNRNTWDGKLQRNHEAKALWAEAYPRLTRPRPGIAGALLSRADAHTLRLSMLYALLDGAHEIRVEHLRAALAFWEYCEASIDMIFGKSSGDPDADKILNFMASSLDRITLQSEIYRGVFSCNRQADWIQAKMAELIREGRVVPAFRETGKGTIPGWQLVAQAA